MKKEIRVHFTDFWDGFDETNNFIEKILRDEYILIIDSENPDYLFFSVFGDSHKIYYNSIKIFYSGENSIPNFNECDYGIAFNYIDFSDRYMRFPLHVDAFNYLSPMTISPEKALNRKFCNFVYSNLSRCSPVREEFFHKLSEYKRVDSGGRYLNNIGGPVDDKLAFIRDYKFTIAFENSTSDGYTTEKISHPFITNSIPIYWGNPLVELEYNPKAFINANRFDSINDLIEEVKRLDNDDQAYLDMLFQPVWTQSDDYNVIMQDRLCDFLRHIVNQPLESARRRPYFGWTLIPKPQKPKQSLFEKIKRTVGIDT